MRRRSTSFCSICASTPTTPSRVSPAASSSLCPASRQGMASPCSPRPGLNGAGLDAGDNQTIVGGLRSGESYARITVADNGVGMSPDTLRQMFDPFFTTKERGRGTGLGLAVVRNIVVSYEGALIVTSRPGVGSVFDLYLPICGESSKSMAPRIQVADLHGSERVLVVDDEVAVTDMLTIGLDRLGYEVVGLNDPEEAAGTFKEDPTAWDVVISDQVMPGTKGL